MSELMPYEVIAQKGKETTIEIIKEEDKIVVREVNNYSFPIGSELDVERWCKKLKERSDYEKRMEEYDD